MTEKKMTLAEESVLEEFQADSGLPKGIRTEQQLWDEIFKKEIHETPFLLMPLIHEIYGEEYPKETPVTPIATEFSVERPDTKEISSIRSDTTMKVGQSDIFHFECEISTDPDMGLRTYDYDSSIALAYPERQNKKPVLLRYPHSAVLYLSLGARAAMQDTLICRLYFPPGKLIQTNKVSPLSYSDKITENHGNAENAQQRAELVKDLPGGLSYVDYRIPAVKVQAYTIKEIQDKHLLILIPFTPIRFRSLIKRIKMEKEKVPKGQPEKEQIDKEIENAKNKLTILYQEIILTLDEAVTDSYISEKDRKCILSLLRKAMIRIFFKTSLLPEVIRMTAPVLELEWEMVERLKKENARITAEKDAITAEKDAITAKKDAIIAEKDAIMTEKDAIIAEKDAEIRSLRAHYGRASNRRRKKG